VTDDILLDGVCRTTALACLGRPVLLLVQDTTSLNLTSSCRVYDMVCKGGLGPRGGGAELP
jgi:hypothetical protein